MTMQLYAMTCGQLTGQLGYMLEGGEGEIKLPIPSFLIEHPKGRALFDTGMHPDCQHDPASRVSERVMRMFRFHYQAGEDVGARLEALDRDPARVDFIINSHLHFDHVGGNALIPNATMVIQKREWDAGMDPELAAKRGFDRRDFDIGHPVRKIEGEYDLFGDGRVVCLPTPGHTPGHQSLKLRLDSGDVVLTGDACYFCRTLRERRLPKNVHDSAQMLASLDKLAALEAGGARIIFGHDPDTWKDVPQAPVAFS
jgi:glyoxylase-like metal-dependent hydrolase (beta-lactamase superfamily II)